MSPMRLSMQETNTDGFASDSGKKKLTAKQMEAGKLFPVDPQTGERVYSMEVNMINELIELAESDQKHLTKEEQVFKKLYAPTLESKLLRFEALENIDISKFV